MRSAGEVRHRPVTVAVQQIEQLAQPAPIVGGDHRRTGRSGVAIHQDDRHELAEQRAEIVLGHAWRAQHDAIAAPSGLNGKDPLFGNRFAESAIKT